MAFFLRRWSDYLNWDNWIHRSPPHISHKIINNTRYEIMHCQICCNECKFKHNYSLVLWLNRYCKLTPLLCHIMFVIGGNLGEDINPFTGRPHHHCYIVGPKGILTQPSDLDVKRSPALLREKGELWLNVDSLLVLSEGYVYEMEQERNRNTLLSSLDESQYNS